MGKLFQVSVEKKYLKELDEKLVDEKYNKFLAYFGNKEQQERIKNLKEEQYQEGFLRDLFVEILGYTLNPKEGWNLTTELKNISGSKKADGAIMKNGEAIAVIELKSTSTTDLDKVEEQAFGYKNHHPNCKYIITSNFEKLRFYIQNAVDYEEFDLFSLAKEEFALLWLCLAKDNIFKDLPLNVKDASLFQEEKVTVQLYKDYSMFREQLFLDILENNPDKDKLLLFKKTQKLLDRFLFIFFAEDRFLLPPNSISKIIDQWEQQAGWGDDVTLYHRFKKYFTLLNKGWKGNEYEIYPYNGGLFLPDELLDNIKISDEVLKNHTLKLSAYNFNPDTNVKADEEKVVDVNILGHIFEHSIGEIENVQAEIKGEKLDKQKSKRKKHGIYYTPKYITKYIVENTVGKLCQEKQDELGIVDEDYAKGRKNRKKTTIKALDEKLDTYREWLLNLTICDPACGSGAFLNQALDFLIEEHRKIDELRAQLFGEGAVFSDITSDILEKNLYGVDLNEESVEIAKLSLWLRTAKKGRKLNTLSNNIKCGNSLIDDPGVAGDKAFKWEEEFPEVFGRKENKAYHVTFALHNSRYAITRRLEPGFIAKTYPGLTVKEQELLAEALKEAAQQYKLNIMECNICHDHVHALIGCHGNELERLVGLWKGRSAYLFNRRVIDKQAVYKDGTKEKFWAKGYYSKIIVGEKQLQNTVKYIRENRAKHDLPPATNKLNRLLEEMTSHPANARKAGDTTGFDVVIGNPPYLRVQGLRENFEKESKYYENIYESATGRFDIYVLFLEKAHYLIADQGIVSFILPHKFLVGDFGKGIRKYFKKHKAVRSIIHFGSERVFSDASTYTCIINLVKTASSINYCQISPSGLFHQTMTNIINYSSLSTSEWNLQSKEVNEVFKKIKNASNVSLKEVFSNISRGVVTGADSIFILKGGYIRDEFHGYSKALESNVILEKDIVKPVLMGSSLTRYNELKTDLFLIYPHKYDSKTVPFEEAEFKKRYPKTYRYLVSFKKVLKEKKIKYKTNPTYWYCLHNSRDLKLFETKKIITPYLVNKGEMCIDFDGSFYTNDKCSVLKLNPKLDLAYEYCIGILNSKLLWFYISNTSSEYSGGYFAYTNTYLEPFPFVIGELSQIEKIEKVVNNIIVLSNSFTKSKKVTLEMMTSKFQIEEFSSKLKNWHELEFAEFFKEIEKARKKISKENKIGYIKLTLAEEAEWMQYFNEQKQKAQTLKAEIHKTDKEIDRMVYELYGLTGEEIRIVEESVK